jgi:hypothetical protein
MIPFKSSIQLPDTGLQEREHEQLLEMQLYLLACARMGADLSTLKVTCGSTDLTRLIEHGLRKALS